MKVNQFFDKVYCLNLDRRSDRWQSSVEEFNKHNLQVERISAVDWKDLKEYEDYDVKYKANIANLKSVISVFKEAQRLNLKSFLFLEDDVEFLSEVDTVFESYAKEVPEDWQMLYLGGNHTNGTSRVNGVVLKCNQSYALHAVGFKQECYELVLYNLEWHLAKIEQLKYPNKYANLVCADFWIAFLHQHIPTYTFVKPLAWQRSDYSDIEQAPSQYDFLLKYNFEQ